jgi:AIPR protein
MPPSSYRLINSQSKPFKVGNRTQSASLLAWFLAVVWRMDESDVEFAICDGGGDKGIDALVVEDDLGEITILQCKHRKKASAQQGDNELKNLVGAGQYLDTAATVDALLASKPNAELRDLIDRTDLRAKVEEGAHVNRLVFVTNGTLDKSGRDYVKAVNAGSGPPLEVWDQKKLGPVARRTKRPELRNDDVKFVSTSAAISTDLGAKARMAVTLVPATQLVSLTGIDDLSLFDPNVRLGLGKTRINKELDATVNDQTQHSLFAAYHNGLTVLTRGLTVRGKTVRLKGIAVVNGCQSLLSLFHNRASLTKDLEVLVRIVEVDTHSDLPEQITYRTNNQNSVDIRDQRSRDSVQRDLQAQVAESFGTRFGYAIRRGEKVLATRVLTNERAAQLIMAVYLEESWNAVRKVVLFGDAYQRIFSRKITAAKLFVLSLLDDAIEGVRDELRDELKSSFASVRFTLVGLLADVLRLNKAGKELLEEPEKWLPDRAPAVSEKLGELAVEVADSFNFFVEEEQRQANEGVVHFDPKTAFKSRKGVRRAQLEVKKEAKRQQRRDKRFLFNVSPL